jgi:nucleoside-diphosphate-sugar epimerase
LTTIALRRWFLRVSRPRIQDTGGRLIAPLSYFGFYLDLPPITVLSDRARTELGLKPTPLDEGLRETFLWYEQQDRPRPDFSWEDTLLGGMT